MLGLVFGSSTAASAAVLAIFLGGLGLGGAILGRRAEASERPLLLYGNLELYVALTAAVTPLLVAVSSFVYLSAGGSQGLGMAGATLLRLLLSALVLGPPVVLMGGTLPAAARAIESESDQARHRVALLYAVNTLGAVCGALLGTFVLFEALGTQKALWGAVCVNLLVAVVARSWGREAEKVPVRTGEKSGAPAEAPDLHRYWVYAAAAVVGFAFLALELVWYRLMAPLLGGSTFTFGLVLAVALAGIGLGSHLYSRRGEAQLASAELLVLTIALEGVAIALPLWFGDSLALMAAAVRTLGVLGFPTLVASWTVVAVAVVLPAALVAGYQFPVLVALLGRGRTGVARQTGILYAFNTSGSIVGALAAGFVLIPSYGVVTTWRAIVISLLGFSLALLAGRYALWRRQLKAWVLAGAYLALAGWFVSAPGPTVIWKQTAIGAGRADVLGNDRNQVLARWAEIRADHLWEKDGIETTVGLSAAQSLAFLINGKSDGNVYNDRGTQTMAALLPALLHENPSESFVLGLGTGMSAGWLASAPGMKRVRVLELEPAVVEVARAAQTANQNVLSRKNVHLTLGDAREFLLTTDERYDLVVSEPSNPFRAGIATLFTREFYQHAKARLKPGGWFVQWLQAYEVDARTVRLVTKTLLHEFSHLQMWQTQYGDLLLLASDAPIVLDVERTRARIKREPFKSALRRQWLVEDLEGVAAHFVASENLLTRLGQALPSINTDDENLLEYAFARSVGGTHFVLPDELDALARATQTHRPSLVHGTLDFERVDEQTPRLGLLVAGAPPEGARARNARGRAEFFVLGCQGLRQPAAQAWARLGEYAPRDILETYVAATVMAESGNGEARALLARLRHEGLGFEAHVVAAQLERASKHSEAAVRNLLLAVAELRKQPFPICDSGVLALNLLLESAKQHPKLAHAAARALLEKPFAARYGERYRVSFAQDLAFASNDPKLCLRALGEQLLDPWWNRKFLERRLTCLERAHHPMAERARRDLLEFLAKTPGELGAALR